MPLGQLTKTITESKANLRYGLRGSSLLGLSLRLITLGIALTEELGKKRSSDLFQFCVSHFLAVPLAGTLRA